MNNSYLSDENLIFKTSPADEKIYIREQKGFYQRIRRSLSFLMVSLFVFIPFIRYDGHQAIYFDLQQQRLNMFSIALFPQDLFIFSLVFILAAFALFYVSKIYGRVWCGFICPQTIWSLMFNWVERRIEGNHNHSKALDAQPMSLGKAGKKLAKHSLWGAISLLTALVFISYFVPADQLYLNFFTLEASSLVVYWVLFFAGCTYVNAGWIRDKMCQHMCPYSRFQGVMFDQNTKLVTYDAARGESRGKRKRNADKADDLGDCVDCKLCVQVCPVGIDIRDGLQYECISCGLCIDACDMTMDKFNYPRGLIDFKSKEAPKKGWLRHLGYGLFIALTVATMYVWLQSWKNFEVQIIRDRQSLYRVDHMGNIENVYQFKIRNKSHQNNNYKVEISGVTDAQIIGKNEVEVLPGELKVYTITVSANHLDKYRTDIDFKITDTSNGEVISKPSSFYGRM